MYKKLNNSKVYIEKVNNIPCLILLPEITVKYAHKNIYQKEVGSYRIHYCNFLWISRYRFKPHIVAA